VSRTETANQGSRVLWKEYRLLFYSALIGIAGGLGAQLFVWILNLAERLLLFGIAGYRPPEPGSLNPQPFFTESAYWLIPVATTLGGLLSGILVYTFAPEAEGHGTDAAVEAFHFKGGKVRPIVPLIKVFASAITIGSGGAAGREGPTAQISVGVGSMLADFLHLPDEDRRILVLAGMAAGLAAIFRSPLGMAIFSVEILYSGMAFENRGAHIHRDRIGRGLCRQWIVRGMVADFFLSANGSFHAADCACGLREPRSCCRCYRRD